MARAVPDRVALEIAHRALLTQLSVDEMLQNPTLKIVLETVARRHMQRRNRVDFKKLQANDLD